MPRRIFGSHSPSGFRFLERGLEGVARVRSKSPSPFRVLRTPRTAPIYLLNCVPCKSSIRQSVVVIRVNRDGSSIIGGYLTHFRPYFQQFIISGSQGELNASLKVVSWHANNTIFKNEDESVCPCRLAQLTEPNLKSVTAPPSHFASPLTVHYTQSTPQLKSN